MTRKRFIKLMMSKGLSRNDVQKYAELIQERNESYENQFIKLTGLDVGGYILPIEDIPFPRSLIGAVMDAAYEAELNPCKMLCIEPLAIKAIASQRSMSTFG